jgi:hypothetical protein
MADGVSITAGTGTTILTDDTGVGGHAQVVKLAISTDGSGTLIPADAANGIDVDVTRLPALAAGTNNIGDVDVLTVPAPLSTTGNGTAATALRVSLASDSTGIVSLTTSTASIGKLAANSGVDIGDVDVLSLPALAAGTNYVGKVRLTDGTSDLTVDTLHNDAESNTENHLDVAAKLMGYNGTDWDRLRSTIANGLAVDVTRLPASTNTLEVVGDVAHDVAAAGNPVLLAGIAQDTDGTAPPNRVNAEGDAVRLATDRDGSLYVRPHGPQVWSYHFDGSTAQTDTSVQAAPGVGLSLYVTDIVISLGAATALNVFFEEGTTTKVLGPYYLEAVNGRGLHVRFSTPKKITANTALTFTSSASVAHCVDVTGFIAQG